MVEASCRRVASAVRHHNRLEKAAVSRIAASTSADTARRMLTVSLAIAWSRRPGSTFIAVFAFADLRIL
jgi:hypothetical protein